VLDPGTGSRVDTLAKAEAAVETGALRSGELARLAGVSTDLVRHYERIGILPKAERQANGYRAYPSAAVTRVRAARRAVTLGFTLAELARFFAARDRGRIPCREVRTLAAEKLKRVEEALMEFESLRHQLRTILRDWDDLLEASPAGKRANLFYSLEADSSGKEKRSNSRQKGFTRKCEQFLRGLPQRSSG
jgi:DNA-binding transcriptional MerR regulator